MKVASQTLLPEKYVCRCGYVRYIIRPAGQRRENKHVKSMFCLKCNKKTKFIKEVM